MSTRRGVRALGFARRRGDVQLADRLEARAADLKRSFNRDFWIEDRGWYAMGLDRDKRPLDALTSNIGHCLWAGIVDEERAPQVASHLMSPAMFTGWGVRTLGATMTGYNPMSYHNGSVWPHDTAICVAGLTRYGLTDAAATITRGLVSSAAHHGHLLPELFGGVSRDEVAFPVSYPTACSPQAWAAAAPLLLLRSMLGIDVDTAAGRIRIAPAIPEWMGRVTIEGIPLAGDRLSLDASADRVDVLEIPDGVTASTGDAATMRTWMI